MKTALITKANFKKFAGYLLETGTDKRSVLVGVTTDDGEVAGTASFTVNVGFVQLDSIYVDPFFRRDGAGHSLMSTIREFVDGLGYRPISVDYSDTAEGVMEFLDAEGFFSIPGEDYYEFALRKAAPLFEKVKSVSSSGVICLADMKKSDQNKLVGFIESMKMRTDFLDNKSLRRDLTFVKFKGSEVCGFVIVTQEEANALRIDQIVAASGDNLTFASLVKALMKKLIATENARSVVRFFGANDKLVEVLKSILGKNLKAIGKYYRAVG